DDIRDDLVTGVQTCALPIYRWRLPCPDIYTLVITNGKAGDLKCLTNGSLVCSTPSWSPDGKTIAFLGGLKIHSGGHLDVYTIPRSEARRVGSFYVYVWGLYV